MCTHNKMWRDMLQRDVPSCALIHFRGQVAASCSRFINLRVYTSWLCSWYTPLRHVTSPKLGHCPFSGQHRTVINKINMFHNFVEWSASIAINFKIFVNCIFSFCCFFGQTAAKIDDSTFAQTTKFVQKKIYQDEDINWMVKRRAICNTF